jgi:hypothetical protein
MGCRNIGADCKFADGLLRTSPNFYLSTIIWMSGRRCWINGPIWSGWTVAKPRHSAGFLAAMGSMKSCGYVPESDPEHANMSKFAKSHRKSMVRAVGIEPTLLSERDFESDEFIMNTL